MCQCWGTQVKKYERSYASLEQWLADHLHHLAGQIHPFPNGNGRWSRLLANIWLKVHKWPLTDWPEDAIGATSVIRDDYLAAVRAADSGDYSPLIELHRKYSAKRQ